MPGYEVNELEIGRSEPSGQSTQLNGWMNRRRRRIRRIARQRGEWCAGTASRLELVERGQAKHPFARNLACTHVDAVTVAKFLPREQPDRRWRDASPLRNLDE